MDLPSSSIVDVAGLDEFATQLRKQRPDSIGYLSVERLLPRNGAEPLGRRNYTRSDLAAFLPDEEEEEVAQGWGPDPDAEEEEDAPAADTPVDGDGEALELTRAVCRWIVELAEEQSNGDADEYKLKIKVWSPKGTQMVYSKRLTVTVREAERPTAEADEQAPALPMRLDDKGEADRVDPGTWGELNRATRTLLRTALGTFETIFAAQGDTARQTRIAHSADLRHLRDAHEASRRAAREDLATLREANKATTEHLRGLIKQQAEQLREAYSRIDELIGETLGFKIDVAELGIGQTRSVEDRRVTADLQKQFIDQAGGLAQLWLASKTGIMFDKDLIELMKIVQDDEALRNALKNPKVLAMLRNPELRPLVVQTLTEAADAFANMAGAGSPPPPSPETP